MKVALTHDWLTGMRGGEYVLEAIVELFPRADLFTLISVPSRMSPAISALPTRVSWLRRLPGAHNHYRSYLPLMPLAMESFDLAGYDLIVSSSHCVAKGVRKAPSAVHVAYVHAPMRYMWDRFDQYFGPGQASVPVRVAATLFRPILRRWDCSVSQPGRVDLIVANSRYIAGRIREAYGREARVVYPFADLRRFSLPRVAGDAYLIVSAFAPYKRIDLAIEAFNRLRLPLWIVGGGQDEAKLRRLAGPTVRFLGAQSNEAIAGLYASCRAFVFPAEEDFGITPLEAMASGAPVIAYGAGGAMETVTPETAVIFSPQSSDALVEAVLKLESGSLRIDPEACRRRAALFSKDRFKREMTIAVRDAWAAAGKPRAALDGALAPD